MTDRIPGYERDPRRTTLDTEVVASGQDDGRAFVVLADTILYPEGGGQPADAGTVGGVAVVDVQRGPDGIRHVLDGPAPSGTVVVELDWTRRFDHMQQHTAQHLLTAVADTRFGWKTVAFHLGPERSDIELDAAGLPEAELAVLEEAVAEEVRAARAVTARRVGAEEFASLPVRSRGLPAGHTGSVRLVEIDGIDLNNCGGTHCRSTAELEAVKLLGTESVRGGTRLFYAAGRRLRALHEAHDRRNARLRVLLGCSDDELVDRVEARLDQARDAERAVRDLEEALAVACAERLAASPDRVLSAHWPDRALPFLQRVTREIAEAAPDRMVFLTAGDGEEGTFVVGAGAEVDVDVGALGSTVAAIFEGRGGGAGRIFQGRATRLSRRQEAEAAVQGAG